MRSQTLHREMQEAEGRMGPDCILQLSQKKKRSERLSRSRKEIGAHHSVVRCRGDSEATSDAGGILG